MESVNAGPHPSSATAGLIHELQRLDMQVRELGRQWDEAEREIARKIQRRRALIAQQETATVDHSVAITRLQGEIYAARDRLKVLRDAHFDFSCLDRIISEARRAASSR